VPPIRKENIMAASSSNGSIDFSFDSVPNQLFKKVENCVYDLRTGRLGVLRASKDAYAVFVPGEKGAKPQIQTCPVTAFGLPIPAYAIRTKIGDLTPGDVVIVAGNSDTWLYYLKTVENDEIQNTSLSGIRVDDGARTDVTLSESMFFAEDGVLCVKNVIGKQTELTKMLPMLALLGAGGKEDEGKDKLSKLILCMLMGQSSEMSGNSLDMKSMLPMMMLSGGNGGGDSSNLMMAMMLQNGGLFGQR
jgi:hypothetical protein